MTEERRRIQLVPLGTRCLVKRYKEEKTAGGIYIPDDSKEGTMLGEVMAVGDGCDYIETGDKVFFGRYSGKEIKQDLDTQTYGDYESILIMVEDDILCKVKEA
tara:strand:- start:6889 stop:7197 length:309 start_codon:yes stop_codon:yes gene_type:complete